MTYWKLISYKLSMFDVFYIIEHRQFIMHKNREKHLESVEKPFIFIPFLTDFNRTILELKLTFSKYLL